MAVILYMVPGRPTSTGVMHLKLVQQNKYLRAWWCSTDRPSWKPTILVRVSKFTVQQVP